MFQNMYTLCNVQIRVHICLFTHHFFMAKAFKILSSNFKRYLQYIIHHLDLLLGTFLL
jgi:hypothetical protein